MDGEMDADLTAARADMLASEAGAAGACSAVRWASSEYSPAGRVVRRAGSSSRRSGACRRAAAGPASASAAASSSATSMASTMYPTGFRSLPAASSLFWRAFASNAVRDSSARVAGVVVPRRLGRTETSDARFPGSRRGGRRAPRGKRHGRGGAGGENCKPPAPPPLRPPHSRPSLR